MVLNLGNSGELFVVDLERVAYFQADDHYSYVYYDTNAHFLIPFGLSKVEEAISQLEGMEKQLVRVGRKYIINLRKVFYINLLRGEVQLAGVKGQNLVVKISKNSIKILMDQVKSANSLVKGINSSLER